MRTNLLRFMFDSAWRFEAAGNELYVGAGWLILIWTLVVSVLCVRLRQSEGSWSEALLAAGFWMVVPAGFLVLLLWQPDVGVVRTGIPVVYALFMFLTTWLTAWSGVPGGAGSLTAARTASTRSAIFTFLAATSSRSVSVAPAWLGCTS